MITRKVLLAVALVGALSLVGGIVAQTNKSKSVTIMIPTGTQTIQVDSSDSCVDEDSQTGTKGDTVVWQINSTATTVSNFHIIFSKKSPFTGDQRYFDKTNNSSTVLKGAKNGLAEAFEYVITVDGGKTCDPHVIIIGAR
jgi:hypothetical protein